MDFGLAVVWLDSIITQPTLLIHSGILYSSPLLYHTSCLYSTLNCSKPMKVYLASEADASAWCRVTVRARSTQCVGYISSSRQRLSLATLLRDYVLPA